VCTIGAVRVAGVIDESIKVTVWLIGKLEVLFTVFILIAETELLFEIDDEEEFEEDAEDADDVVDDEHDFDTINMGVKTFEMLLLIDCAVVATAVVADEVDVALKLGSLDNICFLLLESLFIYLLYCYFFLFYIIKK
jgi:hypothetical protein